jgi:hypothetical protein
LNSKIWVGIGETNIFLEYGPISFKTAQNQWSFEMYLGRMF